MAQYVELDLITDPDALLEIGVDYMEGALAGFVARPGNVETILLEASSQVEAEVVAQAALVDPIIFAYFGSSLVGLPIREATPSTGQATITFAADTDAVMVAAGSLIAVPHPTGSSYAFGTDQDVVAPAGGGAVGVGISSVTDGADANGCFGVSELVDVIDGVDSVVVSGATSGGTDQESDTDYLDRLADTFTILAPRPILPQDFATMARQVPGVGRALAIDLYQPGTNDNVAAGQPGGPLNVEGTPVLAGAGASGVARCTSVVITADGGAAPSQTLMHTTWAVLDGAREVNFLAYVIPPRYASVGVQATVRAWRGYLAADVLANALAQLQAWLDPNSWGSSGATDSTDWTVDTTVRISEAVDYLNRAAGVHWVDLSTVKLRLNGGAWQATDLVLPGTAPLPTLDPITAGPPSTITVQPGP